MFNVSEAKGTAGGPPPAGTLSWGVIRVEADALAKANEHKLRVVIELAPPHKWFVAKAWNFETTPARDGKAWMLRDIACILEAAGEQVEGNPAFNFKTLNEVLRAINGKRCAIETAIWYSKNPDGSNGKANVGVQHFLSPNPIRGQLERWTALNGPTEAGPAAPSTTPAAAPAPRKPAI